MREQTVNLQLRAQKLKVSREVLRSTTGI